MSNIHQNDELLRVQDQNYDIVFNYDKHENGGVAVHAEKDGKNHKVNPEYARAALVKKIGSGGGGWPADLPKPSVGGYGYTAQGEQTLFDDVVNFEGVDGEYGTNLSLDGSLIVGSECDVAFGNEEYNLLVREVDFGGIPLIYIGNDAFIGGEDDGVPFIIADMGSQTQMISSVGESKNLKITQRGCLEHKIDIRYIPNIPRKPVTVHPIPLYTDRECTERYDRRNSTRMFSVGESCDIYLYGVFDSSEFEGNHIRLFIPKDSFSEAIQEYIDDYRMKYYDIPCFIKHSSFNNYEYTVDITTTLSGNNQIWQFNIYASDDAPDDILIKSECLHPGVWIR